MRAKPENFQVDEMLGFEPQGEGEHLYVRVRKRNQNTQWVANLLAGLTGVSKQDVGFAGLKDRVAVTTQWFSLYLPGKTLDPLQLQHNDFEILQVARHPKKLRRGMHAGNRFRILLRDCDFSADAVEPRLRQISQQGVPNYFGGQRFGRDAGNLHEAQRLIDQKRLKGNKRGTGIYLSAARSWLFNLVLAERVRQGSWNKCLAGEAIPQGPLWGRGRSPVDGEVLELEKGVLADWPDWLDALEHAGLSQERRDLVLRPMNLSWEIHSPGQLSLDFELLPGGYATALLREIALVRPPDGHVAVL